MTPTPATPAADGLRALFVHAHPDDEAITTGGTIAALVAAGAEVRVITCTLGEEGEVIGDELSGLVADRADQLGGYRIGELGIALRALGVDRTRFLGGAGRWRDSGMAGTPSAGRERQDRRRAGGGPRRLPAPPRGDLRPPWRVRTPGPHPRPRGGARRDRGVRPPARPGGVDRHRALRARP